MIVIRNERTDPFVFGPAASKKTVLPGTTAVLTDDEWSQVPVGLRGPGGINSLYPNNASSDSGKLEMDYYTPFGTTQIRYLGQNTQTSADTDQTWLVRRFDHTQIGTDVRVAEIQILDQVAWGTSTGDRDALPWT